MNRPPIGFIVEGQGEYNCYPSLFCRSVGANGIFIPIINAGGCGSIVKRIKEQLTDLFISTSPLNVIITVDLQDILEQDLAKTCVELISKLNKDVSDWLASAQNDKRLHPLPDKIICIAQIKKFESWLVSDIQGLKLNGLIDEAIEGIDDAEKVNDPVKWLKENLLISGNVKSPSIAKNITSALKPTNMRLHSRSFDKFYRECEEFYGKWLLYIQSN